MTTHPLRARLRRLVVFLGSGRLAVMLLVAISCVLYLYLVIPQSGQRGEREILSWVEARGAVGHMFQALGVTDVLHSWLFWGVYGLLFVNLSVCMARRLSVVAALCRFPERPPRPATGWLQREVAAVGVTAEGVARKLRRDGYRTLVAERSVYALRGRFAAVGHWVFHAGLLAILVVGGALAVAGPPFGGSVGVGEGEPFELSTARFLSSNQALDPELPPLRFRVESVEVDVEPKGVKEFDVTLFTADEQRTKISINRPHRSAPYQVMLHGFGFMPGWVVVNSRDRPLASAWLKLLPFPFQEQDSFPLGPEDSTVFVRFYPDHRLENGEDRTASQKLHNPRFRTRVVWRGEEVYQGLLAPGERLQLAEDIEFFFLPEIRKYALLDIIEERGHAPVFACFGIMIFGLFLRYGRIRKEILVRVGDESLQLYGHGEIFEHLFAEDLDRLAEDLGHEPGKAPPAPSEESGSP